MTVAFKLGLVKSEDKKQFQKVDAMVIGRGGEDFKCEISLLLPSHLCQSHTASHPFSLLFSFTPISNFFCLQSWRLGARRQLPLMLLFKFFLWMMPFFRAGPGRTRISILDFPGWTLAQNWAHWELFGGKKIKNTYFCTSPI